MPLLPMAVRGGSTGGVRVGTCPADPQLTAARGHVSKLITPAGTTCHQSELTDALQRSAATGSQSLARPNIRQVDGLQHLPPAAGGLQVTLQAQCCLHAALLSGAITRQVGSR
jgi:hypothetical protein